MASDTSGQRIFIGMGTCGLATGAEGVLTAVHEGFDKLKIEVPIISTSWDCIKIPKRIVLDTGFHEVAISDTHAAVVAEPKI